MTEDNPTAVRIAELIHVGSNIVQRKLTQASGGNLSARVGSDRFVVTTAGAWLDQLDSGTFTTMSLTGEILNGSPAPSSEWKLHQRIYSVRSDVNAIVHVHPQYAILLNALGYKIRLITLDHAYYLRSIGTTPYFPNGSDELAESAATQSREHNCIIMAHHGCSTLGNNVAMAFRRALNLEEAATTTYRALLLGDTETSMPEDAIAALHHA